MALSKTFTAVAGIPSSGTASGTSTSVDISGSYASEVDVQIVQVGTAGTIASFFVEFSADNVNFRSTIGPFNAGNAASTYKFGPIICPAGQSYVRIVYTAQTGGTSSTITADVTRTTSL